MYLRSGMEKFWESSGKTPYMRSAMQWQQQEQQEKLQQPRLCMKIA